MGKKSSFERGKVVLLHGDCRECIASLADDSIDACVTDPPYSLVSIIKRFGKKGAAPAKSKGPTGVYRRASAGFMGQKWDTGEVAFDPEFWRQVFRVLKPGGYVLAMGGTRTYHRLACAIEDAGFEIRDQIMWVYGSGFPKSHDVSKAIDKMKGVKRKKGKPRGKIGMNKTRVELGYRPNEVAQSFDSEPESPEAKKWAGWGTALKPAVEPICLARKPISEASIAANVLKHGTGALNVDGCRVEAESCGSLRNKIQDRSRLGRWPANLIHDGSAEVLAGFPSETGNGYRANQSQSTGSYFGSVDYVAQERGHNDSGSAARFFYTTKAEAHDRLGSKHPTIKPVALMQYLVRLVTPKGGVVLDPFAGTGTTGEACLLEGMRAVLIEREKSYCEDIATRMANWRLHRKLRRGKHLVRSGKLKAEEFMSAWKR